MAKVNVWLQFEIVPEDGERFGPACVPDRVLDPIKILSEEAPEDLFGLLSRIDTDIARLYLGDTNEQSFVKTLKDFIAQR